MIQIVVVVLTIGGFLASRLYGAKKLGGPLLATLTCGGWVVFDVATQRFDLLLSAVPNFVIHASNLVSWLKSSLVQETEVYCTSSVMFNTAESIYASSLY